MSLNNFSKKPFLTLVVLIVIVAAIAYLQSTKAGISSQNTDKNIVNNENQNSNSGSGNQDAVANEIASEKEGKYPRAPDFAGIERWINSEPLKLEQLRGKVVLVDFWTYTCINCIRTLPYLKEWDKKYSDKGLVIVGVHTPVFEFEKKYENVLKAVDDYKIKYPVAQDNNYATWSVYENRYWPHKFLIDIDGYIRYDHIGEGDYEKTEMNIRELLKERMERMNEEGMLDASLVYYGIGTEHSKISTPEIYFGYQFTRGNFGNKEGIKPEQTINYKMPFKISKNQAYFVGEWKNNADNMELAADSGQIILIFDAKSINIVAGSDGNSNISVSLDNKYADESNKGSDIIIRSNKSIAYIDDFRLYNLANAKEYGEHIININAHRKGFRIYTFTFG